MGDGDNVKEVNKPTETEIREVIKECIKSKEMIFGGESGAYTKGIYDTARWMLGEGKRP